MDLTLPGGFANAAARDCDCVDCEGIDPTLDSCCAREEIDRRRAAVLMKKLRQHDPTKRRNRGDVLSTNFFPDRAPVTQKAEKKPEKNDDDVLSSDDDDDDDSEEESESDYEDEELLQGLVTARLAQQRRGIVTLATAEQLEIALRSPAVVVLVEDNDDPLHAQVLTALEMMQEDLAYNDCAFRRARSELLPVKAQGLVVFVDGKLVAVRSLRDFADETGPAVDALDRFLDLAGAKLGSGDLIDDDVEDDLADDLDDTFCRTPYPCGKPGCTKFFEHQHIDTSKAVPIEWDLDRRLAIA